MLVDATKQTASNLPQAQAGVGEQPCPKPHHATHTKPCDRCKGRGWFPIRGSDGDSFDCPRCDGAGIFECDEVECASGCADIECTCDAEVRS